MLQTHSPPSVIGLGHGGISWPADIPRSWPTPGKVFLADGDIAGAHSRGVRVLDLDGNTIERAVQHISWDPIMRKGGYKHYMQKEIFEQPRAVRDTLLASVALDSAKVFLDKMDVSEEVFRISPM